jgi:hypothetical protein
VILDLLQRRAVVAPDHLPLSFAAAVLPIRPFVRPRLLSKTAALIQAMATIPARAAFPTARKESREVDPFGAESKDLLHDDEWQEKR